jgi:hypothetical protein
MDPLIQEGRQNVALRHPVQHCESCRAVPVFALAVVRAIVIEP